MVRRPRVTAEEARADVREYAREYNRVNKAATRLRYVWNTYRLSAARYAEMLKHGCALCGADFGDRWNDVDHDHTCDHPERGGRCCERCVRGLLCRSCNLRVGAFERGQNSDADIAAYLAIPRTWQVEQSTLF